MVLVRAWMVIPETTDPVWFPSVPVTVTVALGVAICGVIPVMEMAIPRVSDAFAPGDWC
jgi:hypothetical protein